MSYANIVYDELCKNVMFERKILLENQQKLKTTLFTKYIHICTSHHQLYIQTLYIMPNVVFTMVKKHLSNGQLSKKVVQLIYVGCLRLMQIY